MFKITITQVSRGKELIIDLLVCNTRERADQRNFLSISINLNSTMKTLSRIFDKISFALYGGKSLNVNY